MRHYLQASLAPTTRSSYSSAARSFTNFALTFNQLHPDGSLLPVSEETLMLYVTFLSQSIKPQSLKVYLAAIRNLHLESGFPSPLDSADKLRRLLRGIKRVHGLSRDSRLPITPRLLRQFRLLLNFSYPDHRTLWAAMLVAFFGFLRSNELLAITNRDIQRTRVGYTLHIRASKTDPFRTGATVHLGPSGDPTLCVVAALDWHIAGRPHNAGLLFTLHQGGALTRSKLNSLVKELARRCGVAQGRYTSHSFRIGAASTAAAAGIPDWKVQALGRWNSQCYLRYIRVSPEGPDGVAAAMAGSPL